MGHEAQIVTIAACVGVFGTLLIEFLAMRMAAWWDRDQSKYQKVAQ